MPQAPNFKHIVEMTRNQYPTEWRNAHRADVSQEHAEAFIRLAAAELHAADPRFGLNGKRGTTTLSQDVVAYRSTTPLAERAGGVEIIDVILGAGGSSPSVAWNDVTQATVDAGTVGRWIDPKPATPPPPPPPPPPPVDPEDDEILDFPLYGGVPGATSYQWWRDNGTEIEQAITQWFVDTHAGRIPRTNRPLQHVIWRALREYPRYGRTLREVLQETWPKDLE